MKKRALSMMFAVMMIVSLAACGEEKAGGSENQVPDLTGEWKQTNSNSKDSYQGLYISGDTIEVYWVMDGGDATALYWAGTFEAPKTSDEPYTWVSKNDTEKTALALMASSDDTKEFTYENGAISYTASALGASMTIKAEKAEWGYASSKND